MNKHTATNIIDTFHAKNWAIDEVINTPESLFVFIADVHHASSNYGVNHFTVSVTLNSFTNRWNTRIIHTRFFQGTETKTKITQAQFYAFAQVATAYRTKKKAA